MQTDRLIDALLLLAKSDQEYRLMVRRGQMPSAVVCPRCGARAEFRDDYMAARYWCPQHGDMAAMWADPIFGDLTEAKND
jgi:hypothetical protein